MAAGPATKRSGRAPQMRRPAGGSCRVGRGTAVSPVGNCRKYQQPVLLAATAAAAAGLLGLGLTIGPSAHGAAALCLGGTGLTAGAAALAARAGAALAATAAFAGITQAARRGLTTSQGREGHGGPDEERGHEKAPWELNVEGIKTGKATEGHAGHGDSGTGFSSATPHRAPAAGGHGPAAPGRRRPPASGQRRPPSSGSHA